MSNWEDFAAIASIALLTAIWSEKNTNTSPIAACVAFYLACFYTIRMTVHFTTGMICLAIAGISLLGVLLLLFATDRRLLSGEQRALRGNLTILLVFHFALYCLQIRELVPAEVAALCYTLVAGCVRYNVTAACCTAIAEAAAVEKEVAFYEVVDDTVDAYEEVRAVIEQNEEGEEEAEEEEVGAYDAADGDASSPRASEEEILTPSSVQKEVDMFQILHQRAADSGIKRTRTCSVEVGSENNENSESQSRRQLLRYVFHEMRAPLNAISMAVELLTNQYKTGATPKSRKADLETLQMIEESTLTMERTLKDSMTLQKIEEGLLVPQLKIFSIYDMCDDINDALSQVLKSSSVAFRYEVQDSVPPQVVGDHFRVRHVVAHVVSNAIKYSQPGSAVTMTVHITEGGVPLGSQSGESGVAEDAEDTEVGRSSESSVGLMREASYLESGQQMQVIFCVTDRGVGMSAELQQSDIFKPFSMLKTEDLRASRGSGLGLAICKKIMAFLRGSISYTSIPNQGTTFQVRPAPESYFQFAFSRLRYYLIA
jgi:signal transduction histidine kinase